jgi:outer membrane receptor for ferrienterochelin and colicin
MRVVQTDNAASIDFAAPTSRWRTDWRTSEKIPANRHVGDCLENRFGLLGPTRFKSLSLRFTGKPHGYAVFR